MSARWLMMMAAGAAVPVLAQQAPQAAQTVQQAFEAAAALDAAPDGAKALAAWEALERRTSRNPRNRSIVQVRKSSALVRLGRFEQAAAAARQGLAGLPADPSLDGDRYEAWLNLGQIAQISVDYAGAGEAYARAEQLAETPPAKLSALLGQISTRTFTDPDAAFTAAARADTIIAAAKVSPQVQAQFASAKGVLALNRGDLTTARIETQRAVKLLGGMTTSTNLDDVSARSNAAIALLLLGKADEARRYMAMTGAGRLTKGSFDPAAEMTPPDCGGEADLKPADMAVIEFSIGDDGSVFLVRPIYAAGGGAVAQAFARAARNWSWSAEQVKNLPPFFRYNVRVEMRCSTAFPRPSVEASLEDDLVAWLESRGHRPADAEGSAATLLPAQRAALAAADIKPGDNVAVLAALVPLLQNPIVGYEERGALAARALAIATKIAAPPTATLWLDLLARTGGAGNRLDRDAFRRAVGPLLAAAPYANDARSRAALRLVLADREKRREGARIRALLQPVADEVTLAKNDPLRTGALIRLASVAQQEGDTAAARLAFEKSGLDASQCAILDTPPKLRSAGGSFPQEAQAWGFEGWTRTQFDIDANGKVLNQRAIVSYPPFVFTKAGIETVRGATYTKTYRPDGALGCGAETQGVRFSLGR